MMRSQFVTLINLLLAFTLSVVIGSNVVRAQDTTVAEQQPDSDEVLLSKAEVDIGKIPRNINFAYRADRKLKELLRRYPDSPLRHQAEERLDTVGETLGPHHLNIALFYWKSFEKTKSRGLKGAESRLRHIVCEYPRFSRMDEVLLLLVRIYSVKEDAGEEMQHLQQFIYTHPQQRDSKEACEGLKGLW